MPEASPPKVQALLTGRRRILVTGGAPVLTAARKPEGAGAEDHQDDQSIASRIKVSDIGTVKAVMLRAGLQIMPLRIRPLRKGPVRSTLTCICSAMAPERWGPAPS